MDLKTELESADVKHTLQSMRGFGFDRDVTEFHRLVSSNQSRLSDLVDIDNQSDSNHINLVVTTAQMGNNVYKFLPLIYAVRKRDTFVFRTSPSLMVRMIETRSELDIIDTLMNYSKIVFHKFNLLKMYPKEIVCKILSILDQISVSSNVVFVSCLSPKPKDNLSIEAEEVVAHTLEYQHNVNFLDNHKRIII